MGFFSSGKSDKRRAIEFQINENDRRKYILKELTDYVSLAIRMATKRGGSDEPPRAEVQKISFWKENSVLRVMNYNKLADDDKKSAIEADIAYFHEVLQDFRDKYPEWDIMVRYPDSGEKEPDKILVRKK